ncbi:MAG: zinc metalloprotease HtpX [Hyphomicrobiaceae bacterium]
MHLVRTGFLLLALTLLFVMVGFLVGGQTGMVIALALAGAMNLFAYYNSDKMVLRMHRAVQVDRGAAPELYSIVEQLVANAELPLPKIYVIESPQPNAFATGRNPANSAVAVTTGLLDMLSKEEIAGVIAHELAHIKNRDTLTMAMTATLAGAISMLAQFGLFFGGRSRNDSPLGPIGTLVAMLAAPLAATLVQMAISRSREYAADELGSHISQRPLWLASALSKLAQTRGRFRLVSAEVNPASAHLFIVNPLTGRGLASLFMTHPSTEDRIARLEEIAAEMGQVQLGGPVGERQARTSVPGSTGRPFKGERGPWS